MAGRKVFVGSLPSLISDELLRLEFSKYGQVVETFVKPGCEPGRQWAFVTFATPEQAQFVKETCDRVLTFPGHDRPCDVMLAKNQGMAGRSEPQPYDPNMGMLQQPVNGYAVQPQPVAGNAGVPTATGNFARKIFVGSLPDGITDAALRAEFCKYGTVEDIFIKPGCEPGRQWAFVNFSSPEQASYATEQTNGILQFLGGIKACEVTLARNQGMFGQDPIVVAPTMDMDMQLGTAGGLAVAGAYGTSPVSDAQITPKKIFVGSLPDGITDPLLRAEFSKYGTITDLYMKTTCEPNRQWAFITFATSEQAQYARNSCDKVLTFPGADRACEVTMARHQGMFGKDPIEPNPVPAVDYDYGTGATVQYALPAGVGVEGPRKVFVGSLPDTITDGALRAEFSKYGQIVDLYLKTTCEPGRQWAFITFASSDQAQFAKDSTDRVLLFPGADRACEVMLAKNQGKFGQAPLSSFGGPAPAVVAPVPVAAVVDPAQPPPPATPPPPHLTPWRMYRTASGLPYYHNATTGVTQWDAPPDFQVPGQQAQYVAVQPQPAVAGQQRYSPY